MEIILRCAILFISINNFSYIQNIRNLFGHFVDFFVKILTRIKIISHSFRLGDIQAQRVGTRNNEWFKKYATRRRGGSQRLFINAYSFQCRLTIFIPDSKEQSLNLYLHLNKHILTFEICIAFYFIPEI